MLRARGSTGQDSDPILAISSGNSSGSGTRRNGDKSKNRRLRLMQRRRVRQVLTQPRLVVYILIALCVVALGMWTLLGSRSIDTAETGRLHHKKKKHKGDHHHHHKHHDLNYPAEHNLYDYHQHLEKARHHGHEHHEKEEHYVDVEIKRHHEHSDNALLKAAHGDDSFHRARQLNHPHAHKKETHEQVRAKIYGEEERVLENDHPQHGDHIVKQTPSVDDHPEWDDECFLGRVKNSDQDGLAMCKVVFPFRKNKEPKEGWLNEIDFTFFREGHQIREHCYLKCLDMLIEENEEEINSEWLIQATREGLHHVVSYLLNHSDLEMDPLYGAPFGGLNAIQEAIRGGYVDIIKLLTKGNYDMIIDQHNRSVKDYINLKGSPVRPAEAKRVLGIDVKLPAEDVAQVQRKAGKAHYNDEGFGWESHTALPYDDSKCDIDVLYDLSREDFFKNYFLPGRPFVIKDFIPQEELEGFTRQRWDSTEEFDVHDKGWQVGPTAYPGLTGQDYCEERMSIEEIEARKECEEQPGIPMEVAWHPKESEFGDLWPMYEDDELFEVGGWRKMEAWFGSRQDVKEALAWQVFFGGDGSGATLHWHGPAFNNLYAGTKQWRILPPLYRGLTGMPAKEAQVYLDETESSIVLGCVQHAGDMMYIVSDIMGLLWDIFVLLFTAFLTSNMNILLLQPENWGHSTLTHGFTIGSAVIFPEHYHKPKDIKFFFVHINKTGGTSLINMMRDRCDKEFFEENWDSRFDGQDGLHRTFHTTANSFINRYGREAWDTAYTFTVVRHPLARQVSNFFFLGTTCERSPLICNQRHIPEIIHGDKVNELSDEEKIDAFHQWIADLYEAYPPGHKDHYLFGSKGQGNQENPTFNSTQTSWLVDAEGKMVVKDIFQLEHFIDNMDKLSEHIPCLKTSAKEESEGENKKETDRKLEMDHLNVTPKYPDFKLFAKNKKTKRIMLEVYGVDFENFGYKWPSNKES